MSNSDSYQKFRELLNENYQFPCIYLHKIIGKASEPFSVSLAVFESKFIGLKKTIERKSASGQHLSLTFEYHAASADDVILLVEETRKLADLLYIL